MNRFEFKIVGAMLLIAVIPLMVSYVLVGEIIKASDSVNEGQTRLFKQPLAKAVESYRSLFRKQKELLELKSQLLSEELAQDSGLATISADQWRERVKRWRVEHPEISFAEIVDERGRRIASDSSNKGAADLRIFKVKQSIGNSGWVAEFVFEAPQKAFAEFRALDRAQREASGIATVQSELGIAYRVVFLVLFGIALTITVVLGLLVARRTTKRVAALVAATRRVAAGDLITMVQPTSGDEMGELAGAFNEMIEELRDNRERIGYLEKIGAWQEVARRLAHQIKNPLTPIQLSVQELRQRYTGGDPQFQRQLNDTVDIVGEEVEGLRRLVGDFSSFAKLPTVRVEAVELNGFLDDFLRSHSELAQRANLHWTPLNMPTLVLVDRMLMKHALYNVVENALQAAEEANLLKRLRVDISGMRGEKDETVTLRIADNGPGLSAESKERIFDPYYTTKKHGTGLGLAVVKKIILEHGGTIEVSTVQNQGTTFILTFPLALPPLQS